MKQILKANNLVKVTQPEIAKVPGDYWFFYCGKLYSIHISKLELITKEYENVKQPHIEAIINDKHILVPICELYKKNLNEINTT